MNEPRPHLDPDPDIQTVRPAVGLSHRQWNWVFYGAIVALLAANEAFLRSATGHGSPTVVAAWLRSGPSTVPSVIAGLMWLGSTIGLAMAATTAAGRLAVAHGGRPQSCIMLGPQLDRGWHIVSEDERPWRVMFTAPFMSRSTEMRSFDAAYRRWTFLRDANGNLVQIDELATSGLVVSAVLQLLGIFITLVALIGLAGLHNNGFTVALMLPDAWATLGLPASTVPALIGVWALANAAVIAGVRRHTRGRRSSRERVLPLPACVTAPGAVLPGRVLGKMAETVSSSSDSASDPVTGYLRYCVRFDGPDFPLPIFLDWAGRRVDDNDLSGALGELRRDLLRLRERNTHAFAVLDAAIDSGAPVGFRVVRDLEIEPQVGVHDDIDSMTGDAEDNEDA